MARYVEPHDPEKGVEKERQREQERAARSEADIELRSTTIPEFNDLEHLRQAWGRGELTFPKEIRVAGIRYEYKHDSTQNGITFSDVMRRGARPYFVYTCSRERKEEAKAVGLHQWIIFLWAVSPGQSALYPHAVRAVSPERSVHALTKEAVEYIGDVVLVKIELPSGAAAAIKGKVDTGAEISSLHAENIQKAGENIRFMCPQISQNMLTLPLADSQAVNSADGGVEYRPVVELDILVNDKPVRGAMFNLNDRNGMEYPMLVGQNVLEKTKFLVNPRQDGITEDEEWLDDDEEVNWEALHEELSTVECEIVPNRDKVEQIYKLMDESSVTFQDIIRYVRTEARQVLSEMEY